MARPSRIQFIVPFLLVILPAMVLVAGCSKDEVAVYSIPKQRIIDQQNVVMPAQWSDPTGEDRMLAAILINGDDGWFLKLTGPRESVEDERPNFVALLESIRFDDASGDPHWSLPENWKQTDGTSARFATIEIPVDSGPALELSVSKLPMSGWQRDEYEAMNINRWRKQLGLPPAGRAQLTAIVDRVDYATGQAALVDLVGTMQESGMTPPFAGGGPFASASTPSATRNSSPEPELKYDTPEGWKPAPLSVSRGGITVNYAAAFSASKGDKSVEITVSAFAVDAGSILLPNINRWRKQIGLDTTTAEDLRKAIEPISIGELEGQYIELRPERTSAGDQATFVAIAQAAGRTWFFKLMGNIDVADAERTNFREFVQSVQFE